MKRPDCYEFGMEFLGNPEKAEIRAYVEWLEKRIAELEAHKENKMAENNDNFEKWFDEWSASEGLLPDNKSIARAAYAAGKKEKLFGYTIAQWMYAALDMLDGSAAWHEIRDHTGLGEERCKEIESMFYAAVNKEWPQVE